MHRSENLLDCMCLIYKEDLSKLKDIQNSLAIFVMATYGEGDPTDNAQEFFDWLKDGGTQLEGLRYTVGPLFILINYIFSLFLGSFTTGNEVWQYRCKNLQAKGKQYGP